MAWEDNQPQWGKQKRPPTPEEFIAALLKKIKASFEGGGGEPNGSRGPGPGAIFFKVLLAVGVLFLLNFSSSSFYTIAPGERGVILRLGKYLKTTSSGLNFKVPVLDTLLKVDVEKVRKEEFGFRTTMPGQKSTFTKQGFDQESLMLTGDKNVIDVEWIVQYTVLDPVAFLFKVQDVAQSVRDVSEVAIRRVVGNQDFDYVLSNREVLEGATMRELQEALTRYESGVKILTVKLQDVNPPDEVKPAFNEVNEADQDMKRSVNEAEETYNRIIPKARGDAKKILEEAHGYAMERVNVAQGDVARFVTILKEYRDAKQVTRRRLYLEAMEKVMPLVSEVVVINKEQRSLMPFLDVGRQGVVPPVLGK